MKLHASILAASLALSSASAVLPEAGIVPEFQGSASPSASRPSATTPAVIPSAASIPFTVGGPGPAEPSFTPPDCSMPNRSGICGFLEGNSAAGGYSRAAAMYGALSFLAGVLLLG